MEAIPELTPALDAPALDAQSVVVSRTRARLVARLISAIFSPPLIILLTALYIATTSSPRSAAWRVSGYLVIAILFPVLYTLWLVQRGAISDFHINVHKERTKPMLIMLASTVAAWLFLLLTRSGYDILTVFAGVAVLQFAFLLLITLRWKISGHTTAISSLCFLLLATQGSAGLPFLAAVPLVVWGRVYLRRHTLAQALAGVLAGVIFTLLALYLISR